MHAQLAVDVENHAPVSGAVGRLDITADYAALDSCEIVSRLRTVVDRMEVVDVVSAAELRSALRSVGWRRVCEGTSADVVALFRRVYADYAIEYAEVVLRVRHGDPVNAIAEEVAARWMTQRCWQRESRACRLAQPPWWPNPGREQWMTRSYRQDLALEED